MGGKGGDLNFKKEITLAFKEKGRPPDKTNESTTQKVKASPAHWPGESDRQPPGLTKAASVKGRPRRKRVGPVRGEKRDPGGGSSSSVKLGKGLSL